MAFVKQSPACSPDSIARFQAPLPAFRRAFCRCRAIFGPALLLWLVSTSAASAQPLPFSIPGGKYIITLADGGKALDADGPAIDSDDGLVHLWDNTKGGITQVWTVNRVDAISYSITLAATGKALDADGPGMYTDGGKAHLWSYNGGKTQKWLIRATGNGTFAIILADGGKALDAGVLSMHDNDGIVHMWSANLGKTQKWVFTAVNQPLIPGKYVITLADGGKALDADGPGMNTNDGKVHLWDNTKGGITQVWTVNPAGFNAYSIVLAETGKALDADGPGMHTDGGKIHLWSYDGGKTQKWLIRPAGNGTFAIVLADGGKALDAGILSMYDNDGIVHLWNANYGKTQKWVFTTWPLGAKPMDVISSADGVDDNGFLRNPNWRKKAPNADFFCPTNLEDPRAWNFAPNCTDQALQWTSGICSGHMDWFPVTYEGTVNWGGHSNSVYDDDDYYFDVMRADQALYAGRDNIHMEFDSSETVDYWDGTNTWWESFHRALDGFPEDNGAARALINNSEAIIVGRLGLDTQHGTHSELHPAYALFVRPEKDLPLGKDHWAFFVRNWGNEGYCASGQKNLQLGSNVIRIRIRHATGVGFSLTSNVSMYGDDLNERNRQSWTYQQLPDGVLLTFNLRDPSKQVGMVGDLNIDWGQGGAVPRTKVTSLSVAPGEPEDDGDKAQKAKFEKLDTNSRRLLLQQVKSLTTHAKGQPITGTAVTPPVPQLARPTNLLGRETGVQSVPDPARIARQAKEREFILNFLKARGIQ